MAGTRGIRSCAASQDWLSSVREASYVHSHDATSYRYQMERLSRKVVTL
jgi:hypothetical protein